MSELPDVIIDFARPIVSHDERIEESFYGMSGTTRIVARKFTSQEAAMEQANVGIGTHYVLRYLGWYVHQDRGLYHIFEYFQCTLRQLLLRQFQHLSVEEQQLLQEFAMHRNGWITKQFKWVNKNILRAFEELYSQNTFHGDLTVDNVGIFISRDRKIHVKTFGVRPLPNLTRLKDFTDFGALFEECFALAQLPLAAYDEANDFRQRLNPGFVVHARAVSLWLRFEQNPSSLLLHPVFWDAKKRLNFVIKLGGMLSWLKGTFYPFASQFRTILDDPQILSWQWLMDSDSQDDITNRTYGIFEYTSFTDLLRIMRHKAIHFLQLKGARTTFLRPPDLFYDRFRQAYPSLMMRAHRRLEQNAIHIRDIPCRYFEEFNL